MTKDSSTDIRVPVVISFTDSFLYPACLFLFSAATYAEQNFRVVLAHDENFLSQENVQFYESLARNLSVQFEVFKITSTLGLRSREPYPPIVFAKLIMADEFPGSFLWLDVDTLPLSGWQQIFEVLDFNSLVGAVPEGKNQTKSATYDELLKRFDGNEAFLKNGLQYFNTGVIFINAQKWRDSYFSAQWRELLDSYSDYRFQFLDQCILNFLVGPDYVELPRQFNVNASQKAFNPDLKILHFLGKPKPWEIRRHAFSNFGSTQGRILWRRIEKDFLRFAKPLSSEDRELIRISRENLITISWLRDFLNRGLKNRLIPFVVKLRAYVRS